MSYSRCERSGLHRGLSSTGSAYSKDILLFILLLRTPSQSNNMLSTKRDKPSHTKKDTFGPICTVYINCTLYNCIYASMCTAVLLGKTHKQFSTIHVISRARSRILQQRCLTSIPVAAKFQVKPTPRVSAIANECQFQYITAACCPCRVYAIKTPTSAQQHAATPSSYTTSCIWYIGGKYWGHKPTSSRNFAAF